MQCLQLKTLSESALAASRREDPAWREDKGQNQKESAMRGSGAPNQREAILMAVLLHGELYGREIRKKYEERTRQSLPLGSLYVTLDRMEEKGFVRSRLGESNPDRGGNRRKYYKLTGRGMTALSAVQAALAPVGALANA